VTSKLCTVFCRDATGAEHSVEVTARTLYEAVGLGLQIFRANEWVDGVGRNWALKVAVQNPEVMHSVRLADSENWLEGSGRSTAEQALKVELRSLLGNRKTGASR
jgi:hypothetical protein